MENIAAEEIRVFLKQFSERYIRPITLYLLGGKIWA